MFQVEQILQQRYQLQKPLGRTAAGHQTWLAVDLQSQERVTVKLLAFSPQMRWEELKLFEREAQILQALSHPHLPRYRDYFDLDKEQGEGVPWFALVQDYIPGHSLEELLEEGYRFSQQQVRSIATQVLEILIYLHELSPPVLHRDIKPSNLIWGEDKHIYLVDFGAVQAQAAVTGVTFTIVGTVGYTPLEQFWGRAVPASDLYALGATLIHLLTGVAPAELPQQDSRIQFSDRVSLKPDLLSWIEKATEIARERRFTSAREALEALQSGKIQRTSGFRTNALNKIAKPPNTKIKLNKFADRLEIEIPAGGMRRLNEIFSLGCGGIIGIYFLLSFSSAIIFAIPTIGLLIWGLIAVRLAILGGERTQIQFNRQQFELSRKIWLVTYRKTKCANQQIAGIFLHRIGSIYQVCIRSADKVYNLGGALREEESAWLAQEIQEWLR